MEEFWALRKVLLSNVRGSVLDIITRYGLDASFLLENRESCV